MLPDILKGFDWCLCPLDSEHELIQQAQISSATDFYQEIKSKTGPGFPPEFDVVKVNYPS